MTFLDFHDKTGSVATLSKITSSMSILEYMAFKSGTWNFSFLIPQEKHIFIIQGMI
jgi:hypothetical protein